MISKDDILKLETRRTIYDFIMKYPGLHLREISRRTNIPLSSLKYHLNYLEKLDLFISKADHRYKRYYIAKTVGKKDKEILNLLRQETPLRIVLMLLSPGPGQIFKDKEIQKEAYCKHATFEKNYSKKEIIELTKYWKGAYDDFRLIKHRTTIGFHLQKLLDVDLIEKIKVGKETKYKLKDQNEIWEFFIKYKHALSKKSVDNYIIWESKGLIKVTDKILNVIWEILPHPYHA